MPRKIYDIKPPKAKTKKEPALKNVSGAVVKKKRVVKKEKTSFEKKRNVFIVSAVVVLLLGIYLFIKLPRATIQIWPKLQTLSFEETISADKAVDSVDEVNGVIPAKYFEVTKTSTEDFSATGNADNTGRATGTITIFNKYDPPTPLTLKAGTHFLSDSGKLFVILERVTIPAAKKSGTKITQGSIQVKVQSVEGGETYNIAPSNFSVPGLKGTAYYYGIYATSSESMSGGYAGKLKKVTDDDIQGAEDSLTQKASDNAISDLKGQLPDGYVLLDNAIFTTATDSSADTKVGTVVDQFKYTLTVKASALAFKQSDIDSFVKKYAMLQIPDGTSLLEGSMATDYTVKTIDVSSGRATIVLDFTSSVYESIDQNALSLSLMNKNADQINQTIEGILADKSDKTKVSFWPFWVTKSPNNQKAVHIELKFN